MKPFRIFGTGRMLVVLIIVILAAAVVLLWPSGADTAPMTKRTITEARVKQIREMVRLQSLEIYEETSMRDTVNGKGIFATVRLTGTVSYDLEKLHIDSIGRDSIRITLPPEKVELLESTEPGSYRVVDVWDARHPLLPASLSASEENTAKTRLVARKQRLAYDRGYVREARAGARETLQKLFSTFPGLYIELAP